MHILFVKEENTNTFQSAFALHTNHSDTLKCYTVTEPKGLFKRHQNTADYIANIVQRDVLPEDFARSQKLFDDGVALCHLTTSRASGGLWIFVFSNFNTHIRHTKLYLYLVKEYENTPANPQYTSLKLDEPTVQQIKDDFAKRLFLAETLQVLRIEPALHKVLLSGQFSWV